MLAPLNRNSSLLEPTGPYTVGLYKHDLYDENRPEVAYPSGRLVPVQVYFPASKGPHLSFPKALETRGPQIFPLLDVDGYSRKLGLDAIAPGQHPLVFFSHGLDAVMTDYSMLLEDLASHGCVVVSIQHLLETDPQPPAFWKSRSYSNHGSYIDNMLYVYEWIKHKAPFRASLDRTKVTLMGHSLGCNSLLLLSNVITSAFKKAPDTLLPHDIDNVTESLVMLDPKFLYPEGMKQPILFCLSEERQGYQESIGTNQNLALSPHTYKYYKGARHVSFLDQSWVSSHTPGAPNEKYFNGTDMECRAFWQELRDDIRAFLKNNGGFA